MEHYPARSHSNIISVESIKKYDDIRFVDLTFLLNWTSFFSKVMDKQVQLGVKGRTQIIALFSKLEMLYVKTNQLSDKLLHHAKDICHLLEKMFL